jgi:indole-3-glycerol phosphate synthase
VNFLERVVAEKRAGVAARRQSLPFETLAARLTRRDLRDFHGAVARPGSVIAELKARTPTIASFVHSGNLLALAGTYHQNGAAAISIVTDPARFGTSLADVARVRDAVPLPVIAKDFVVDGYQILEARAAGADAILLIVRLLDLPELKSLFDLARDLGLDVLVEAHDETEVLAAITTGARIIGVNNRNLETMAVSLDTTRRLAPLVPDDIVLVAESGIGSRADIDALAGCGARAFLVGGSLLDSPDPGAALRAFTGGLATEPGALR